MVGLKFGLCVIAKFRNIRGTKDNGWLCGRGGNCGAVGVTSILIYSLSYVFCFVAIFVLYSFICASRSILFINDEKIPKNPANSMRATLFVYLLVCVEHMCYRFLLKVKKEIL